MIIFEPESAFALHDDPLPANHIIARAYFNIDVMENAIPHILREVEVAAHISRIVHYLSH